MVLLEEDLRGKTALGEEVQRLKDVVRGESGESLTGRWVRG